MVLAELIVFVALLMLGCGNSQTTEKDATAADAPLDVVADTATDSGVLDSETCDADPFVYTLDGQAPAGG